MTLYGYITQRDLSQFEPFLFVGLIGIALVQPSPIKGRSRAAVKV